MTPTFKPDTPEGVLNIVSVIFGQELINRGMAHDAVSSIMTAAIEKSIAVLVGKTELIVQERTLH